MARTSKFTPEQKAAILADGEKIAARKGDIRAFCKRVRITVTTYYRWRDKMRAKAVVADLTAPAASGSGRRGSQVIPPPTVAEMSSVIVRQAIRIEHLERDLAEARGH